MKNTLSKSEFRDAFNKMGRGSQFTYDGLGTLFDYLENLEESTGQEMELDVIAICCDFTEYESVQECADDLGIEGDEQEALEHLINHTTVIDVEGGGIIIQSY